MPNLITHENCLKAAAIIIFGLLALGCGYVSQFSEVTPDKVVSRVQLVNVNYNDGSVIAERFLQISEDRNDKLSLKLVINTRRTGKQSSGRLRIVEVIPKSFALDAENLEFSRPPTKIIDPDPVIAWDICELAMGEDLDLPGETDPCESTIEIKTKEEHPWLRQIKDKYGGSYPEYAEVRKELRIFRDKYKKDSKGRFELASNPEQMKAANEYEKAYQEYVSSLVPELESVTAPASEEASPKPEEVPTDTPAPRETATVDPEPTKLAALRPKEILDNWISKNSQWRTAAMNDYDDYERAAIRRMWDSVGRDYLPYFATGDFNKDSERDFAAIVIEGGGKRYGLLVFNGPFKSADQEPAFFSKSLQRGDALFKKERLLIGPFESDNILFLVPKGRTYVLEAPDFGDY